MQTEDFSPNYWVVGASPGGEYDPEFVKKLIKSGIWYCFDPKTLEQNEYEKAHVQRTLNAFKEIKEGDRIAIKKMMGPGENNGKIEILALGVVKAKPDYDADDIMKSAWRVYVDWLPFGENHTKQISRVVPMKSAAQSIHGPFKYSGNAKTEYDPWIRDIFCI